MAWRLAVILGRIFQSTLSMRRATPAYDARFIPLSFQSTLSMRRATAASVHLVERLLISIHALHEESDVGLRMFVALRSHFNPRSP